MKKGWILFWAVASVLLMYLMSPAGFAAQTITSNQTGTQDGYDYELWKDNGTTSMTLNNGGAFSCSWSNINNALFRKGKKLGETQTHQQLGNITMNYACNYQPNGNSYLAVYGWTTSPLVEYYIIESWGSWRPPGASPKGTVTVDGGTYEIYETTRTNQPSIKGTATFQQYWSVRTSKRTSGTISVSDHFKAWESKGMRMGKMYEVSLVVEGYQSSGKADVTSMSINIGGANSPSPSLKPSPSPTTTSGPVVSSGLPVPPGDANVAKPLGAAGNLRVINWAGFKGAVSYSFDDANSSQINNYSKLNALGVRFTFYLQTNKSEAANNIWSQAKNSGHELGNHTQSHAQNGSGSDIDAATNFIQQHFGVKPLTMAAPYGNSSYVSLAQSRFLVNRGVAGGSVAPNGNADPFNLPCNIPATGAQASALTSTVSSARSAGNWQIFCIHGFSGGSDGAYQPIDINQFTNHVTTVKGFGDVWMDTVLNVAAYWRAQKLFSSLKPTYSGNDIVYKWTLPANFPAGKYLRVSVSGGTLQQNNRVLNWDSHGYYEIALDAGSLTITE